MSVIKKRPQFSVENVASDFRTQEGRLHTLFCYLGLKYLLCFANFSEFLKGEPTNARRFMAKIVTEY